MPRTLPVFSDATKRHGLNTTAVWTSFVLVLLLLLFLIGGLLSQRAFGAQGNSAPAFWELPSVGPPTTSVLLQGGGFDPLVTLDFYFDSTLIVSATTDPNGAFGSGIILPGSNLVPGNQNWVRLKVPATAQPGQHTITAQQRVGQKSAQRPFLVRTDWAQYRFAPDHAAANPYENVLNISNVAGLTTKWIYRAGYSSATLAGGVLYVGSHDYNLYAIDAATGTMLWSYHTGNYIDSTPAVAQGAVYFGAQDDYFYALKAADGSLLWKFYANGFVSSSPSVANGVVYFGNDRGVVYALDAATGTVLWSYDTGQHTATSSPTVAGQMVFVQVMYYLYAFDAATGKVLWTSPNMGYPSSTPAYANGIVYAGGGDYFCFFAFNANTGQLVWRYSTKNAVGSSPAVANGLVYFGSADGGLYALNASNGALVWKNGSGAWANAAPAIANGVLYITSTDYRLSALDAATGTVLWSNGGGGSPAVADGTVYVAGTGATVAYSLPQ